MTRPWRGTLGVHWGLDPDITFLNHGSFGACPKSVLAEQLRLRGVMEADPVQFMMRSGPLLWRQAIEELARFLHADPGGLAFVTNATTGVNTVLRSLRFRAGDELLVSDHGYRACSNAAEFACRRAGARVVEVPLPFQPVDEDDVVQRFLQRVTDRTRLALFDSVTSPTGMRLPFERLVRELQDRGVDVLLDAAHGPGLVPLDLEALGAAYVTGNCHKWLCAPKGAAFLYVRADRRQLIDPLTVSHGYLAEGDATTRFRRQFDWQGTQDPTPWLCIPAAIAEVGAMSPDGWSGVMATNHALALEARDILGEVVGADALPPVACVTAMVAVRLPESGVVAPRSPLDTDPLEQDLYDRFGIQAMVQSWAPHGARYLRVSTAPYNAVAEYRYLAGALSSLI